MTQATDSIPVQQIRDAVVRSLDNADAFIERLRGFESAEAAGRHKDVRRSILSYAISGYLATVLADYDSYRLSFIPVDTEVVVSGTPIKGSQKQRSAGSFDVRIEYPEWLAGYFTLDDEHFDYLCPESTATLAVILDSMQAYLDTAYPLLPAEDELPQEYNDRGDDADWPDDDADSEDTNSED